MGCTGRGPSGPEPYNSEEKKRGKKVGVLGRGGGTRRRGVNGLRPEGEGRGAFYSAGGTARRSFAIDLKRIPKRTGPNPPRFSGLYGRAKQRKAQAHYKIDQKVKKGTFVLRDKMVRAFQPL